jgi:hypothetical protein
MWIGEAASDMGTLAVSAVEPFTTSMKVSVPTFRNSASRHLKAPSVIAELASMSIDLPALFLILKIVLGPLGPPAASPPPPPGALPPLRDAI